MLHWGIDACSPGSATAAIRRSSASAGARCGAQRLEDLPPFVERSGSRTSAATPTGSTARSARTTPRSSCPVYAVGGWADGYSNAVLRLLEGLHGPAQGPDRPLGARVSRTTACPGPAIGFLQEALRWWDHWLKGIDTGDHGRAACCASGCRSASPPAALATRSGPGAGSPRPGRGRSTPDSARRGRLLRCNRRARLDAEAADRTARTRLASASAARRLTRRRRRRLVRRRAAEGDCRPTSAPDGRPVALLRPRRRSAERLEILGAPAARRSTLAADRPQALLAVRLYDVAPDGASTLVTLRPAQPDPSRRATSSPSALEPGRRYEASGRS